MYIFRRISTISHRLICPEDKKACSHSWSTCNAPDVLILDEPTAGLDPAGRDEILGLLLQMKKDLGITIILVSHSMEDVAEYVDRIIVMNSGEVMFDGVPKEVFSHYKELEEVGLAAPQVTYLMHDLVEKGIPVDLSATTVAEARDSILRAFK